MADVLLVIDVQNDVVSELTPDRRHEFLGVLVPLIDRARGAGVPVVYVRDSGVSPGTTGWEIAPEIAPHPGEPIVDKDFGDAFRETNLDELLASLNADHIIASGMQTENCVAATIRGAGNRYRVTLAEDAHATWPWNGRSEAEIRDEMHAEAEGLGVRLVPAAGLFA